MPESPNLSFWRALIRSLGITFRHARSNPLVLNWLTAGVLLLIFAGYLWSGSHPALAYNRVRVDAGEWWRFFTPMFVHASRDHLTWNIITMFSAGVVAERLSRARYAVTLALSSLTIGLVTHFLFLQTNSYIGASGVAAAVFTMILVRIAALNWRIDPWVSVVSLGILAGWGAYEAGLWGVSTPWEVLTSRSLHGGAGHRVIPFHLVGMATALPIALWPRPNYPRIPI